jgi:hypothetical protein
MQTQRTTTVNCHPHLKEATVLLVAPGLAPLSLSRSRSSVAAAAARRRAGRIIDTYVAMCASQQDVLVGGVSAVDGGSLFDVGEAARRALYHALATPAGSLFSGVGGGQWRG